MQKALGLTEEDEISKNGRLISEQLVGNVGLFFTNSNEDFVLDYFEKFVKLDFARGGAICTESFEVKKGALMRNGLNFPNNMEPMLRKLGLPTELQQGVLVCRQDHQVCKQGTVLTPEQAHLLKHFGVQMAYFKINVIATLNISTGEFTLIKK
jgi:mRNA turnover protein 4